MPIQPKKKAPLNVQEEQGESPAPSRVNKRQPHKVLHPSKGEMTPKTEAKQESKDVLTPNNPPPQPVTSAATSNADVAPVGFTLSPIESEFIHDAIGDISVPIKYSPLAAGLWLRLSRYVAALEAARKA